MTTRWLTATHSVYGRRYAMAPPARYGVDVIVWQSIES